MSISKSFFGRLYDGNEVYLYSIKNSLGTEVKIINYGAALVQFNMSDRYGNVADIIGGYDDLVSYVEGDGNQGAVVGRCTNRTADGRLIIDGREYRLTQNDGQNHLHGGKRGFDKKFWKENNFSDDLSSLSLSYASPDGEEGYPGRLDATVKYTLTDDNALVIEYLATTSKKTPVNLTNHTFFNLAGYDSGNVYSQILRIDADKYLPTNEGLIPTGNIESLDGMPFDFRMPKPIGKDIGSDNVHIKRAGGYDICYVFGNESFDRPILRAKLYDENSGRALEVYTDQPCMQLYSANFLTNGRYPLKNGYPQSPHTFVCLETQKMPDSVNHPNFTNVILNVGEEYRHTVIYKFSIE